MQPHQRRPSFPAEKTLTSWEKSSWTLPSWSSRHSFPSLEWASIPNNRNLSPARPSSCFVDLNCDTWLERVHLSLSGWSLTVNRCSRSREGIVDGEKWSFRKMTCLMTLYRFRIAFTRESAEPISDRGPLFLRSTFQRTYRHQVERPGQDLLFESAPFRRPIPLGHIECVDDEYMRVHIEDVLLDRACGGG